MEWARIMAPLSGGPSDRKILSAAITLAAPFNAEILCVYLPADVAELIPWMGDGFMGGVQASVVDSIRTAGAEGEHAARSSFDVCDYATKRFMSLKSPVFTALAMESRLADAMVFGDEAARGRGPLAEAFRQIVADEQRPTLVARAGLKIGGLAAVAWDGGKEASRAVRTALPLLQKASEVLVLVAPAASSRKFDPERLVDFLAARGVPARTHTLDIPTDPAAALTKAARAAGADILVAGAFGHPRLREFIFGSTTRSFLNTDGPSLFLSH